MPRKSSKKANKKARIPRIPANIDISDWTPIENLFETQLYAEMRANLNINSKVSKEINETFKEESDGQKSFASIDLNGNTLLHSAANENHVGLFIATIKGVKFRNPKNNKGKLPGVPFHRITLQYS